MWTAKLKLRHDDCPIVNRCQKFKLVVYSYPSTWYEAGGRRLSTTTCFFGSAEDDRKRRFIDDLKKDRRLTNIEVSGDYFTYEIDLGKKGEHVMLYRKECIFFVKPTINHHDGHEYWEVASWKRQYMSDFITALKKHMDICEILRIKDSELTDVYIPNVMPKLTKSQKKAIEIAYNNHYYAYPRKVSLEDLASIAGVGISTYQEHLRKAEMKLLPVIIERQLKKAE